MDPPSLCSQGVTQSEAGLDNGGLNQGGSGLPLECSGFDQPMPSWGSQLQIPDLVRFLGEPFSPDEGLNQGGSGLPLECSGFDQPMPSWGSQLQTPDLVRFLGEPFSLDEGFNQGGSGLPLKCLGIDQPQPPELLTFLPESISSDEVGHLTLPPVDNDFDEMSDHNSKRKRKSTSLVWKSFKKITGKDGKERAQCIKCRLEYLIDSKKIGTSTLNRHVKKCLGNETHELVQLEPMDQGPEPIPEGNIIGARTPERPCVPQVHNSPAVQPRTTLSSPASGVTKRRPAFRPTAHDSANKSAGTEADGGKSSTPPAATEEEVQAPRDLQLSLATTKSGPQEESGSVHKQFASAEELTPIGEHNEELENEAKGSWIARGKPMQLFMEETQKHRENILSSLYQLEVLEGPRLRRELDVVVELLKKENSSFFANLKEMRHYMERNLEQKERVSSARDQHKDLEELELENEGQSSWIDGYRQILLGIDKSLKHKKIIFSEAIDRHKGILARAASEFDRLKTFVSRVEGILGVGLESTDPEV